MKPSDACASKWFIQTQRMQHLDLVNLKCVTYAQPVPLHKNDPLFLKIGQQILFYVKRKIRISHVFLNNLPSSFGVIFK